MAEKMISEKNPQLYALAGGSSEYEKYKSVLDGFMKDSVTVATLNAVLGVKSCDSLAALAAENTTLLVLHDGTDIRKPETKKSENLGKVRALDGTIINGYQALATVVVNPNTKDLRLLQLTPYSNGDPQFVSQQKLKEEKRSLAEGEYNQGSLIREQILSARQSLQNERFTSLIHVLDRGFDDLNLFQFIEQTGDKFVIRLKNNRLSAPTERRRNAIEDKLLTKTFRNQNRTHSTDTNIKTEIMPMRNCC